MKLQVPQSSRRGATSIAVVLVLCVVTLLIMTATLQWSSSSLRLTERNNEYQRCVTAAEAATEKAISTILSDYKRGGEKLVKDNMAGYAASVPNYTEDPEAGKYVFNNGLGVSGSIYVQQLATAEYRALTSKYKGLNGYVTPFRIIANASQQKSLFNVAAGVRQDFELDTIPLFQFAIFYNIDMEIHPGPIMDIRGPVFGNENIYIEPVDTLTFYDSVSAAGSIILDSIPGDPLEPRDVGTVIFDGPAAKGNEPPLILPVGTNNTPEAVRQIVEPPNGESPTSELGSQKFYNKADMIITVTNDSIKDSIRVTSGRVNNFGTVITPADVTNSATGFISLTSFYNAREDKTVKAVQIDVANLKSWNDSITNPLRSLVSNSYVAIIYVIDYRPQTLSTEAGVRVFNGTTLPSAKGLTIATRHPIYVWGDYNAPAPGTTNTANTYPAAFIGDAITILSKNWKDANASSGLSSRQATDTTVNAAFLAGIVPTTSECYSGGVENFPRFLEDWGDIYFTYNGSMVVMYPSQYATGLWGGMRDTFGIYNPPNRRWAFDQNFRDMTKLPPGTPMSRGVTRSSWKMVLPNTTNVVVAGP